MVCYIVLLRLHKISSGTPHQVGARSRFMCVFTTLLVSWVWRPMGGLRAPLNRRFRPGPKPPAEPGIPAYRTLKTNLAIQAAEFLLTKLMICHIATPHRSGGCPIRAARRRPDPSRTSLVDRRSPSPEPGGRFRPQRIEVRKGRPHEAWIAIAFCFERRSTKGSIPGLAEE